MTTTDILTNARRFREETGELSRAEQLKWFGKTLGIKDALLLRLIGYSAAEITRQKAKGTTFEEMAAARPDGTVWVSELFRELADRSGYDMSRLAAYLRRRTPTHAPRPTQLKKGQIGRPMARSAKRRVTLRDIRRGGPDVMDRLAEYLRASPSDHFPRKRKAAD